jgi:hypothetical protein
VASSADLSTDRPKEQEDETNDEDQYSERPKNRNTSDESDQHQNESYDNHHPSQLLV